MLERRNPLLLISGIGISFLGSWIYLIALNLYHSSNCYSVNKYLVG
ncbi:hypothetical protein AJ85_18660 [Alkalihalobacillus alcalophilus ATCC 27647 = CGMCC 1.3604]|uniref:Uncharacterized protein n=1 Tax=Alkalihalobacillus alcalophilus ATCC 27647 = CGMCC 1.3604 TaxID=1218173 RepID=A0A4S4K033_ALKAL|nr:hypothetical protein AJ85_18660 [Alkalihalobacillus alcalophilus ATCC 27647 = CGMCC 1.3604]